MSELRVLQWQERDIYELRERETRYRESLARQLELSERLRKDSTSLQEMLRARPPSQRHLGASLFEVANLSKLALRCERASVWLVDECSKQLRCSDQLVAQGLSADDAAPAKAVPSASYLAILGESTVLAIDDANEDSRADDFRTYLEQRAVGALLDIAILVPGQFLGIIRHEYVSGARMWEPDEVEFAVATGSLVALALETERRVKAEHAERESDAKYRHLVETLPSTVYAIDMTTGKLRYMSPRALDLTGWTAEQWIAAGMEHWVESVAPEHRTELRARYDRCAAAQGFPSELNYRVKLPDGRMRWIRDTCSVVRDAERAVVLQGVLRDVTTEMEARLERDELNRRNTFMLEHSDVHAVVLDCEARVTYVNDYLCRATGLSRETFIGHNWFEFTAPAAERSHLQAEYLAGLARGGFEPRMHGSLHTASHGMLRILWTTTLYRDSEGVVEGIYALGQDITQRLRLEAELQQQAKVESLGRLAASVAHDFNNLLTLIHHESARLGALTTRFATSLPSSAQHEALEAQQALQDAVGQASGLTHSLLVYGREDPNRRDDVELDELVTATVHLAKSIVGPSLLLSVSQHSEHARVRLDRTQLRQVLLNLVGNAADATRGFGTTITISTHVELVETTIARSHGRAQGGEFAVLTVADDGRGMDSRTLTRIFEPFFTTKVRGHGTGLGLAMCHSIVERAGGFVAVQSATNAGSRFQIYMPITPDWPRAPRAVSAAHAAACEPVREQSRSARILIVDDMSAIRQLLVRKLRAGGFPVREAGDLVSATHVLSEEQIDMLVTDANLPDGSGTVLARSARKVQPDLKVILISGGDVSAQGFDAILLKPFELDRFFDVVTSVLAPALPDTH